MEEEEKNDEITAVQNSLQSLEQLLLKLQEQQSLRKIQEQLAPGENAQLNSELAFVLNSLYFSFLRANGFATEGHKIINELNRVKKNMIKVKQTIEGKPAEQEQPRNFSVNADAASRMIQHEISQQQRANTPGNSANRARSQQQNTGATRNFTGQRKKL